MTRNLAILLAASVGVLMTGCNLPAPGTTRSLGEVEYESAFATARETMAQYFAIESADPRTGEIISRPTPITAAPERLLGGSPARHLAKLCVRRKDGTIVAQAAVAFQREGSTIHHVSPRPGENYDGVPTETPADETAATSAQQNEVWRTDRYDHALEHKILTQIYESLHPQAK